MENLKRVCVLLPFSDMSALSQNLKINQFINHTVQELLYPMIYTGNAS